MKFLTTLILTFAAFLCEDCISQVTQEWVARYNSSGTNSDAINWIAVGKLGNIYVTGSCSGSGVTKDYCTIKYNSSGDTLWVRRYNGPGNNSDAGNSIAVDNLGNVYVTGESPGSGTDYDYCTIKYNSSGDTLWVRRYNGPDNLIDAALSLTIDNTGNVYVTGLSEGISTDYDYCTIKYNSSGDSLWVKRFNGVGSGRDQAASIALDSSGNVYVTGLSWRGSNYDYATIKYNSAGIQQWVRTYHGPGGVSDNGKSLAVDKMGNIYVTGYSFGSGTSDDYCTIKYNTSGDSLWVRRYNGPQNSIDQANFIDVDTSGNVYVTGSSNGVGTQSDFCTIKYNSLGDSLWVKRYNGPNNTSDLANCVKVDNNGNVYVTGQSTGIGSGYDFCTIKYNPTGDSVWVERYNGPGNGGDMPINIALDIYGNVFTAGASLGLGTGSDFCLIKYSQEPIPPDGLLGNILPGGFIQLQYDDNSSNEDGFHILRSVNSSSNWSIHDTVGPNTTTYIDSIGLTFKDTFYYKVNAFNSNGNSSYSNIISIYYQFLPYPPNSLALIVLDTGIVKLTWSDSSSNENGFVLQRRDNIDTAWAVRDTTGANVTQFNDSNLTIGRTYDWRVYSYNSLGNSAFSNIVSTLITGTENSVNIPDKFALKQNYPNPFNPVTKIDYDLPVNSNVKMIIFDITGREVSVLINDHKNAGRHTVSWDGSGFGSGVYFYRIEANGFTEIRRMMLVK
ncbi:MAG: SBBP repeat-containing protein [Ignavibacteriae bacterium]|nr:SBBP repeat-containing protein [Ignavibacteriota bacterium]MCB9242407.1 SBBP repeat-containing protein [Ignavibacteriales bacterium]